MSQDNRNRQKNRVNPHRKSSIVSAFLTVAVIVALVLTSPASAVQLNLNAPDNAQEGEMVGFDLGIDIENDERVPFDNITITIDGPVDEACTFTIHGAPLAGCDGFTIVQTNDFAPYGYGYNWGYGFDGTSTYNTTFGYGYGYGYAFPSVGPNELFYRVEWNSTGAPNGTYEVSFFTSAALNDEERTYNLESAQSFTLNSTVLAPAPEVDLILLDQDNGTVTLSCTNNFDADDFTWNFGDGDVIASTPNQTVTHTYAEGEYTAFCIATDTGTGTTGADSLQITVDEDGTVTPGTGDVELIIVSQDGGDVTLQCTNDFDADTFDWSFGDGDTDFDSANETVSHTYESDGTYTANCVATNTGTNVTGADSVQVTVDTDGGVTPPPTGTDANLFVKPPYPIGADYVFVCEAQGFEADTYDFDFGDGSFLWDVSTNEVFHTYAEDGTYTVFCQAQGEGITETDLLTVNVSGAVAPPPSGELGATVLVQDNDPTYTFTCQPDGFTAETYDWNFGDGTRLLDTLNQTMTHTYGANGPYDVTCTAWDQETDEVAIGFTRIQVDNAAPPAQPAQIQLTRERIDESTYAFACLTPDMDPIAYDWEIYFVEGSGFQLQEHDIANQSITHRFTSDGRFVVSCTATDLGQTLIDWMFLTVENADNESMPTIVQETPEEERVAPPTQVIINETSATLKVLADAANDILLVINTDAAKFLDLSALTTVTGTGVQATMPISATFDAFTSKGRVLVDVPSGITISSTGAWDGIMTLPSLADAPAGVPGDVTSVIQIGSDVPLVFDKGVRIMFEGRAGEGIAFEQGGVVTEITATCAADTQAAADALAPSGACKIASDGDLVVWTKHFTRFVTFTSTDDGRSSGSSGRSGGGGGGYFVDANRFHWVIESDEPAESEQPEQPAEPEQTASEEFAPTVESSGEAPERTREPQPSGITGFAGAAGEPADLGWLLAALVMAMAIAALLVTYAVRRR